MKNQQLAEYETLELRKFETPVIVSPVLTPEEKRQLLIRSALERLLEAAKEQEEERQKRLHLVKKR
jgi:hypothetical protein